MADPVKHILLIRFSSLGDVAMIVPVIAIFLRSHPEVKISILTKEQYAPLFSHLTGVEVIHVSFEKGIRGFISLFSLAKKIKTLEVDSIADLHNVLRTKLLKLLLPSLNFSSLDKGRDEKRRLTKGKIFTPLKSTFERYADVIRDLDFKLSLSEHYIKKPLALSKEIQNQIAYFDKPMIGIAPFAAFKSKMYPLQQMKRVISSLSKNYFIILFGAGDYEIKTINNIVSCTPGTYSAAGKYTLEDELKLISNLNGMIAMDSGNAHMAAMMGVSVITLWGVTHPYAGFKPFNQPFKNCLLADRKKFPKVPTSVYGNKYPKEYEGAISTISEDSILQAVKRSF